MRALRRASSRLAALLRPRTRAEELMEEIETHISLHCEELVRRGWAPEEARREARMKFGGIDGVMEGYRDQEGLPWIENLLRDLRFGWRSLRRAPAFGLAVVVSIALGIAAATAIFSVAHAVLLRPLPYRQPESLVTVSLNGSVSAPLYEQVRRGTPSLEGAALFDDRSFDLSGSGEPERLRGARVSAGLFDLLGVPPRLGRAFSAREDAEGHERVVVLSDALWRRRFGADPGIVGRTLQLDGVGHEVIGVMPPGFGFPLGPELPTSSGRFPSAELWRPLALQGWERECDGCFNFAMVARLRQGAEPAAAQAEMRAALARGPLAESARELSVRPLDEVIAAEARTPLLVLSGAVGVALLIVCANVSNLLLARGLRRRGEISLRLSLGATRGRVAAQLLAEAMLLGTIAVAVALPLAAGALRLLLASAPAGIPRFQDAGLDLRVLGFAVALTLLCTLVFGLGPALLVARRQPADALAESGLRGSTARWTRLRAALVVAEVALSVVLVAASSSLLRSYLAVTRVPLGFRLERVLTVRTSLPESRFDEARRATAVEELVEGCSGVPGVVSVAAVNTLPLTSEGEGWGLLAADHPAAAQPRPEDLTMARVRVVTPGYFRTLGIPLLAGRGFTPGERGRKVAVVSRLAARALWPGRPPEEVVGRRLAGEDPITVVGVVEDTRASGIDLEVRPYLYVPWWVFAPEDVALVARTRGDPLALADALRAEVRRVARDQPIELGTASSLVEDWMAPRRFQTVLMSAFGSFAVVLAAVGIFGLLSYTLAQKRRELAVRVALGASRCGLMGGVARQAGALALAGGAVGLALAILALPLLASTLYGVGPVDPWALASCALILLATALAAAMVPAWRAGRVDPAASLRAE